MSLWLEQCYRRKGGSARNNIARKLTAKALATPARLFTVGDPDLRGVFIKVGDSSRLFRSITRKTGELWQPCAHDGTVAGASSMPQIECATWIDKYDEYSPSF